jgi:uncharacterized repeat protein (TIGR03847 family)
MTILLLIRHASNDFLKEGKLPGWTPGLHINAQGQREADALARRLDHVAINVIYASPLDRAMDTAKAVAQCQHLPIEQIEDLGDTRIGEWQGKKIKDLESLDEWKHVQNDPATFRFPGGESFIEIQARLVNAVDQIIAKHPDQVVAIFSHADPIKLILTHYLKMELNQFQRLIVNPASVTVLFVNDKGASLFRLNDGGKLPAFKPEPKKQDDKKTEEKETKMAEPNILYDLNPVTHITADAVGTPGKRTFYLQGRQGATIVTLIAEKEHLSALTRAIDEMLERLEPTGKTIQVDATQMELSHPIEPTFRIGQLGLGYDAEQNLIVLIVYELAEEEGTEMVNMVRFWATREQMRALARHAAGVIAGGRPICVLCGRPIDPEGHFCPKRNGHGEKATLT